MYVSSRGGARTPLSRRRVLESALAVVDREGAEALTMRRLGDELGVAAMSLYNHVRGRDELLDGLSEILVAEIDLGDTDGEPREVLARFVHGIRAVALAHPAAFGLVGDAPAPEPGGAAADRDDPPHAEAARPRRRARSTCLPRPRELRPRLRPGRDQRLHARGRDLAPTCPRRACRLFQQFALNDRDTPFAFGADALLADIVATAATS